jgi:hypothetical protein
MCTRIAAGFRTAVCGLLTALLIISDPGSPAARATPEGAPDFRDRRDVDLSTVYSTSYQEKLERISRHLPENSDERRAVAGIVDKLRTSKSPPLVAVVRGDDIRQAVVASARYVTLKDLPARPLGPDDRSPSKKFWLFVYLGHDSSTPPQWLVHAPTVLGPRVQFTYTRFDSQFWHGSNDATADDSMYLYWVPLGMFEQAEEVKVELVELTKTVKAAYPPRKKN